MNPIYTAVVTYNREVSEVLDGKEVAKYEKDEGGRQFIHLTYGDKDIRIRIDGYNMLFIKKSLYNNEVTNAILK